MTLFVEILGTAIFLIGLAFLIDYLNPFKLDEDEI